MFKKESKYFPKRINSFGWFILVILYGYFLLYPSIIRDQESIGIGFILIIAVSFGIVLLGSLQRVRTSNMFKFSMTIMMILYCMNNVYNGEELVLSLFLVMVSMLIVYDHFQKSGTV